MKEQIASQLNVKPVNETSTLQQISQKMHGIETKGALMASRAEVNVLKAYGSAREMIHRRPLTSVLAGLGVGCVMGGLTGLMAGRYTKKRADT
jgi:hypothetical protein